MISESWKDQIVDTERTALMKLFNAVWCSENIGKDLPLFSGTPQAGKDPDFTPQDEPQQQTLYTCPICKDTGYVESPKAYGEFIRCDYCRSNE